ncbi:MAG: amidohydrolase family protein [Gemmatimonadota bacterium]
MNMRLRTRASRHTSHSSKVTLALLPLLLMTGCEGTSGGEVEGGTSRAAVTLTEGTNMAAAASPDGEAIVLALQAGLWRVGGEGGAAERLTDWEIEATAPAWSPDGSRIAFQNFTDGYYQIWTVGPDGSGARPLTEGPFDHREPAWSPDGSEVAFSSDRGEDGSYDIWTIGVTSGEYERRTSGSGTEHTPAWSPDGSRIAYASGSSIEAVDEGGAVETLASVGSGSAGAPAWRRDGEGIVYQDAERQLVMDGAAVTTGEDVFPFPVSWLPDGGFIYTADGEVRVRDAEGGNPRQIAFTAELELNRPQAGRKDHGFDSAEPRPTRGIFSPVLSPDGERVAFVALNDVWVMEIGEAPVQLTDDVYVEWVPSWSPDGAALYVSSDRHGDGRPDMYAIDLATREVSRASVTPDSRMVFPTLSPDGQRFAYIDGGDQSLRVHDLTAGTSRQVAEQAYRSNVGKPSWSPDGSRIALADVEPANSRFREGRNLIRVVEVETGEWSFHEPGPVPQQLSERFEAGPAWSPDGQWMAFTMGGTLHLIPVDAAGAPTGEARQLTDHIADMPSWSADSGTILYVSNGILRAIGVDGAGAREIPVDLTWTPAIAEGVTVVHAGGLWDGLADMIQENVEIRIEGGRITGVAPIEAGAEEAALAEGARFIDATGLTVMPGMLDAHVHPRVQDYAGQWWAVQLAYGITTVLSNGTSTYHTWLAHESLEAGTWVGPRLLTALIFDGPRPYYGHHRAVTDEQVLELELEKAREMGADYLKAYVRAPATYMRRIAEVGQEMGVPTGSHFLSPGIQVGLGGTTHLSASQRMGYSWAESPAGRSYQDVIALYSQGDFHLSSHHTQGNNILGDDPEIASDPRLLELMPPNYVEGLIQQASTPPTEAQREATRRSVATPAAIMRAGGLVTIGSDSPLSAPALGLHARLRAFAYEVTNHEALQAVTINAARYSHADHELGSVEPGKIADLVMVRGNPLEDVANAANVELVMRNGITFTIEDILQPYRQ